MRNALSILLVIGTTAMMFGSPSFLVKHEEREFAQPKDDMAVVYFLRPTKLGYAIKFWIFDEESVLTVLKGSSYSFAHIKPGKHMLWACAENVQPYLLEAKAGETYYFHLVPVFGVMKARLDFLPRPKEQGKEVLPDCKSYITLTEEGKERGAEIAEKRVGAAREKSEEIGEDVFKEEMKAVQASATKEEATQTVPVLWAEVIPINLTVYPIEFLTVQAVAGEPRGRTQSVTITVMGNNIGRKDYIGIVEATLLDGEGNVISVQAEKKDIEEDKDSKPIEIVFTDLSEETVSSIAKYKLDFSVKMD